MAKKQKINFVVDGSNADDKNDFRPGSKAAQVLGIRSPLQEAGLTKAEIRVLSKQLGLPTWDKPTFACLSSRFPYKTKITENNLTRVAAAEDFLRQLGLRQVRVRHYDRTARIEVPAEEISKLTAEHLRPEVVKKFNHLGYLYVTVDLKGYRTGSLNEQLIGGGYEPHLS